MSKETKRVVTDAFRHLPHDHTKCTGCEDIGGRLDAVLGRYDVLVSPWVVFELPAIVLCRYLKGFEVDFLFLAQNSQQFLFKLTEMAFFLRRYQGSRFSDLPDSLQGVLSLSGVAFPLSPQLLQRLDFLIGMALGQTPGPGEAVGDSDFSFGWTPNDERPISSQTEQCVKRALESVYFYPEFTVDLPYKIYKGLSVEAHPFVKLYQKSLQKDSFLHEITTFIYKNSAKNLFKDFLLFVCLWELRGPKELWVYLPRVLPVVAGKLGIPPPVHLAIVSRPMSQSATKKLGRVLYSAMGSIEDAREQAKGGFGTELAELKAALALQEA